MSDTTKKVTIDIKAETSKATNEIKRLNRQIDSLNKQQARSNKSFTTSSRAVKNMGASFATLSEHLARLLVIYGSFSALSSTIKTFASFEQALVTLGTISGATGDELKALEEKALALGETTVFTASQVAGAMTEMARAGLTATQQLDGIEAVLNLAVVGMVDLKEASITTTMVMNGFGLEATDMSMIVDVLSASINSSAQDITQLSNAIKKVAPVVKAQNISLQETVSILGLMADAGIKAERGGTQLKISIERIANNVEARKYINELGVSMFNTSNQLLPFTDRLRLLKGALDKLSPKDKGAYITRIFGSEALATANILLDNITKIELQTKFLTNSFGVADLQARKMMDTLQGSYKELLSALEGLQIKIGKELAPTLRAMVDDATDFVRSLSAEDIKQFGDAISSVTEFIVDLGIVLVKIGKLAVNVASTISSGLGLSNVNAEMVILIATLVKFRTALIDLSIANPILFAMTASLGVVALQVADAIAELEKFSETVDDFTKVTSKSNKTLDSFASAFKDGKLTSKSARTFITKISDDLEDLQKVLDSTKARIAELQPKKDDYFSFFLSDKEAIELESLITLQSQLNYHIETGMEFRNKAQIEGQRALNKENASRTENNKLSKDAHLLAGEDLKIAEKMLKTYDDRKTKAENTLNAIYAKEKSLHDSLVQLEENLANTRKSFADERVLLNFDYEQDIATIRASSLSDLQQYNDAQRRADTVLANAKEAILNGNLTQAKHYFSTYESLIKVQTNSEIKNGELVVRTKQQLNNELIDDKKRGHEVALAILKQEEDTAIALINNEIALKKNELDLNKKSMDIQLKMLELQTKLVATLSGNMTWDEDFKKARVELDKLSSEADTLVNKQRKLEIDAVLNRGSLDKDIEAVEKDVTITPDVEVPDSEIQQAVEPIEEAKIVMTITDLETGEVETKVNGIRQDIEKPTTFNLDTTQATQKMVTLKRDSSIPTRSEHTIMANNSAVERARVTNSKNTSSTHTIYVKTVQTRATGGFIPRDGALGGYGGGDKVKSLLEAGEFIVRKEAVRSLGLDKLHQINQGKIPKYQTGGLVGGATQPSTRSVELNLNLGNKVYNTMTDNDTAEALARHLSRSEF